MCYNDKCYFNVCKLVCVYLCVLSHVRLFAAPRTVARQALLSVEFFRQEYWSGVLFLPPGDLPNSGNLRLSRLLHWQADSLAVSHLGSPYVYKIYQNIFYL